MSNINNFPSEISGEGKAKIDTLKSLIMKSDADICGLTEFGRNEDNISYQNRPSTQVKEWCKNACTQVDWLKSESKSVYEPGGVMMIAQERAAVHIIAKGGDSEEMGRWAWITLKGKRDKKTTIITTYRARNHQQTALRQLGTIRKNNFTKQPEEAWEEDLTKLINEKKTEGSVIVMGDFNDNLNMSEGKINKMFSELAMKETLNVRYGEGPATYFLGSTKIDGIYATLDISISQGGYVKEEESPGDHKCLWIDVNEAEIVGRARDDRPPPVYRKATCKIPSVKEAFSKALNKQIDRYGLHAKAKQLVDSARVTKSLSTADATNYESIEERLRRAVSHADNKCRKARTGHVPFSRKQKQLMGAMRVLRIIYLRHKLIGKRNRPRMHKLQRAAKKYKYNGPMRFETEKEIIEARKDASVAYSAFRPKAHEAHNTYLGHLAQEKALETGREYEEVFKEMRVAEKSKKHFKSIKRKERRGERYGVDRVDVPTASGLKTLVDKDEIENAILVANKEKLLQARHTPLREEPLRTIVGERMDYKKWEELLRGEVELPEDLEEGTKLWFDAIQNFDDDPIEIDWTTEEYFDSWRAMTETKSSMPGIHAAHIKSIDPKTEAAEVVSWMALIPLITGYAPKKWKKGIDSMIPKKKDEWRPEKLRLILLMDARFNHNNKFIGKKMMEQGEKKGYLAREQFGSRKEKSAIEHALNKRITIDIARQSKTPAVYIANDAKSCYDRILLMVAYLTMRQMNIPRVTAISCIETLVMMERTVKTVYGESDLGYATSKLIDEILHGIGQGNGYGPIIWAGISSPLLKILRERKFGVSITAPITREELEMAGYSFVDDTDQIELRDEETLWENVIFNAQASIDLWECLLRTTGGAIEPSKTDWVRVIYEWKKGNPTLEKANPQDELFVQDPNGDRIQIEQIEPTTARRTLGVWQAASGQEDTQTKVLKDKISDWGAKTKGMTRSEATTASISTIGRTVRYPLGATAMNQKQCTEVDSTWKKHVLGKMGVVRTAPKQIVYSPIQFGGIGLHETEVDQMIDHVKMLLNHGHAQTITGKLIRNTLQQLVIELGMKGNPFSQDLTKIKYLTENTWIENTIRSCYQYQIMITATDNWLKEWIETDEFVMTRAINILSTKGARQINKVRMYLRVATWSDLMMADGKSIDKEILFGTRGNSPSPSRYAYQWPNIPKPTPEELSNWKSTIMLLYDITENCTTLKSNHWRWFKHSSQQYVVWNLSKTDGKIYQKLKIGWKVWESELNRRRRRAGYRFKETETICTSLGQGQFTPITIEYERENMIKIISKGRYDVPPIENTPVEAPWYSPLTSTVGEAERHLYIQKIAQGEGSTVCDGSFKNGRSTATFVVQHEKTTREISNQLCHYQSVNIPGHPIDQSSYRGELGGILAALTYTNELCVTTQTTGTCTLSCDNKGALDASFGWKTPNPNWKCFDIVSMIRCQLRNSPIQWKNRHVKGHQDDKETFLDLDAESQANVIADEKAKEEWKKEIIPRSANVDGQPWKITCQGTLLTGNVENRLRHVLYEDKMKKWWMRKCNLEIHEEGMIEWDAYASFRKLTPRWRNTWAVKYGAGLLPTGQNLERRGHRNTPACPWCNEDIETTTHIFQCKHLEMTKGFEEELDKVDDFLRETTSNEIREAVLQLLQGLRNGEITLPDGATDLSTTMEQQFDLGQKATLNGMWLKRWTSHQSEYLQAIGSRKKARVWVTQLALTLQAMVHNMWKTRNEAIHKDETSAINSERNKILDQKLDEIFSDLPKLSLFRASDRALFRRKKKRIKKYRIVNKENWVTTAERVKEAYFQSLTPAATAFLAYFRNTTTSS